MINIIVYPALYAQERNLVRHVRFLVIEGRLQKECGTINLIAPTIRPMPLPDRDRHFTDDPEAMVEELPMPPVHSYR